MEALIVYLSVGFSMFTGDQESDHAVKITQTHLYKALSRQHHVRNVCLHEWIKDVLLSVWRVISLWASIWMDHNRKMHFQFACVCSSYECMFSEEQEWKSERAWKLDWHIWAKSIIDKRRLFDVVYKDNGLTGSTYKSCGIRACVKQTEWRATVTNPRFTLLTVCTLFFLPPWPGSIQLKHFSHDN